MRGRLTQRFAAMMSVLGLQTAMITRFSPDSPHYRQMMNAITGGFVYGAVIVTAAYMLLRSSAAKRRSDGIEPL